MPYEFAVEIDQARCLEQGQIAQEQFDDQKAQGYDELVAAKRALQASVRFGSGQLCTCGMMCAEDCDCHLF
jgi:hypothetical protein